MLLSRHPLFRFALCAAVGSPLLAQTTPSDSTVVLDNYVVTATRTTRPVDTTPGTVTATNLLEDSSATIRDALRDDPLVTVPFTAYGSTVAAYSRGGNRSVNVRGIEGNRVLMMVDGIRLPDEFSLGGSEPLGRDYLDPDTLKRVELFQGSASALYGSDAIGGVVAFMTKSPEDYLTEAGRDFTARYRLTADSVNESFAHSLTAAAGRGSVQGLVVYTRRDGHETANNGSVRPDPETFTSDAVLAKLSWAPAKGHRFEFTTDYVKRGDDVDVINKEITSGTGTTTVLQTKSDTERFRLSLGYTFNQTGFPLFDTLDARIFSQDAVQRDRTHELINYNPASATYGAYRDRQITTAYNNDSTGLSVNATKKLGATHRLAYGADTSTTDTDKPWSALVTSPRTAGPQESPRMADTRTFRLGAYVQDEMDWTLAGDRHFALIPGVRVDHFKLTPDNSPLYLATAAGNAAPSFDKVAVSPKLGVLFGLTPRLNAYAQYNRGFRYPSAEDLTATFSNAAQRYRTLPNPNLKEETSDSYEVGVKGQFGPALHVRVSAFYNTYDNFIEQIATAPAQYQDYANWIATYMTQNRADARIYGGDVAATLELGKLSSPWRGVSLSAGAGRARGSYRAGGGTRTELESIEPFKANVRLGYDDSRGRWGAGLRANYATERTPASTTLFVVPAATVFDLDGYWRLHERVSLRFNLRNLTDKKYWRYDAARGLAASSVAEQERRTEPGFSASASLTLFY